MLHLEVRLLVQRKLVIMFKYIWIGKFAYSGSVLCVIWFCHDFSDLTQGALKLDLFYCWIMTSGICKTNELQPSAKDFKTIFKWNLGHTEVNSKTLYSFLGQKHLITETWTFCRNIWTRFSVAWISGPGLQGEEYSFSQNDGEPIPPSIWEGGRSRLTPGSWAS